MAKVMPANFTRVRMSTLAIVCLFCISSFYWMSDRNSTTYILHSKSLPCPPKKSQRIFPDAIGIGIRKCGTGVYMHHLKRHGSFRIPVWPNYETEYFTGRHSFGPRWYQNIFKPIPDDQLAIEKTPHYFYAAPKSIPEQMLEVNPAVKIFLLLCDPTPRTYSCFVEHHFRDWHNDGVEAFEEWVERLLPDLQNDPAGLDENGTESYLFKVWRGKFECLVAGLYSKHMERWKKVFNNTQMLVLDGEAIMKNPGPEYTKIQDFFGVPHKIKEEDWVKNNKTGHFCLVPPNDRTGVYCQDGSKARTRSNTARKPNEKIMNALRAFYKPYNEKLFKILGKRYQWS